MNSPLYGIETSGHHRGAFPQINPVSTRGLMFLIAARSMLEGMNTQNLGTLLIGIVVIGYILYRQTQERPVKANPIMLPLILTAIGVAQTANYLNSVHHVPIGQIAAVLLGFGAAALIAVPRAHSTKVYRNSAGVMVRRGGPLTMALWVVAIAAHIGISLLVPALFGEGLGHGLDGLDGVTLTIYLAISLGVQGMITQGKAARHQRGEHSLVG